jgi:CheY-like chemotaxis protein
MARKSILVADDSSDLRFAFQAVLNYDGYRVYVAENGAQGIACAREYQR